MKISKSLLVLIFITFSSSNSFSSDAVKVDEELDRLYQSYTKIEASQDVEKLVLIDTTLRDFINKLPRFPTKPMRKYWKEKYSKLGLEVGRYSDQFQYSGKFLQDAHKLDPNSKFRKFTLYKTIFEENENLMGIMPDIKAAYRYINEFPDGPFNEKVNLTIASFHKDLYMVLRDGRKDYKYDCYKNHIESIPYKEQMENNQKTSIKFYNKVLALNPNNEIAKRYIQKIQNGDVEGWSYCSD